MIGHLHDHVTLDDVARACGADQVTGIQGRRRRRRCRRIRRPRIDRHIAERGHWITGIHGPELHLPPLALIQAAGQRPIAENSDARIGKGAVAVAAHKEAQRLVAHGLARVLAILGADRLCRGRLTLSITLTIHNHEEVNRVLVRRLPLELLRPGAATEGQRCRIRREDQAVRVVGRRLGILQRGSGTGLEDVSPKRSTEGLHADLQIICRRYTAHGLRCGTEDTYKGGHDRLPSIR